MRYFNINILKSFLEINSIYVTIWGNIILIEKNVSTINSNMDTKIEVVYNSSGAAVSQVDLSPYPFGVYLIIAYRFVAVIWHWSNSMRFKTIEKEDSVELTANGLILRFNNPIEYVAVIKIWG